MKINIFKTIKQLIVRGLVAMEPKYRSRDLFVLPPSKPKDKARANIMAEPVAEWHDTKPKIEWFDVESLGNFKIVSNSNITATILGVRCKLTDAIEQLAIEWADLGYRGEYSNECISDMLAATVGFLETNTEADSLRYIVDKRYEEALLDIPHIPMYMLRLDSKELLQRQLLEELTNLRMYGMLAWEDSE